MAEIGFSFRQEFSEVFVSLSWSLPCVAHDQTKVVVCRI